MEKKSKEKSWEEFGRRLDSYYFSANKVADQPPFTWQKIKYHVLHQDSAGNILTDENEILSHWRECFDNLLNPVKASTRGTLGVTHSGEEKVFTAAEESTEIKGINSENLLMKMKSDARCCKR